MALNPTQTDGKPAIHPEFESEKAYIDHAYAQLERGRAKARLLTDNVESRRGGTHQARYERDVISEKINDRLDALDIGDQSLVFGRIDLVDDADDEQTHGEPVLNSFYIGRVAVWSDEHDPLVVDWRAPVSGPFYRATGRESLGLARRRHFASRGRELLGVEDEYFGERRAEGLSTRLKGEQTLIATLESARTGRLGDIVGTIQGEQDEIIRSALPGIMVVQGGPGTGKTVVALHRAAYLLYTHRFPLAGQGVLVLGPNRLFLTYIEQVLPSLGESGIELSVLGDLVPGARVQGGDVEPVARIKGDLRMGEVVRRAVRDRERPLREDLVIGHGLQRLKLTVGQSKGIIDRVRQKARNHNHGRKFVVEEVHKALARSGRYDVDVHELRAELKGSYEMRETLEWMWPVLTPSHLLHDLFGSRALLRSAGEPALTERELRLLHRPRTRADQVIWTTDDVPILDEARAHLGPRPSRKRSDEIRTYGHIVIDEAQDLSPMELRMVSRRSLNGSITIVGDIAQATSAWAHDDWASVLAHLPDKPHRMAELTVGYRLPAPTMELASKVLAVAVPGLAPPVAVRSEGDEPRFVKAHDGESLTRAIIAALQHELSSIGAGNVGIIATDGHIKEISVALTEAGIDHGLSYSGALEQQVSIIAVSMVKGLEIDSAIVVDPQRIIDSEHQPLKSLYVAVTRATKRLTIVHPGELPAFLV